MRITQEFAVNNFVDLPEQHMPAPEAFTVYTHGDSLESDRNNVYSYVKTKSKHDGCWQTGMET